MEHVTCYFRPKHLEIRRGHLVIGCVTQQGDEDPILSVVSWDSGPAELTFNDIAIIQDNWVQFKEMQLTANSKKV